MNKADFDAWNFGKKVIYTQNLGYVYSDKSEQSQIVSDITLGGVLKYKSLDKGFVEVMYPDKRIGYIKREEVLLFDSWLNQLNPTKENIETVAKTMNGFPYLWGGTSSKGMDCSGFTKMVYLMNGFIIPRDASQQVNAGEIVDKNLVFFQQRFHDQTVFGDVVDDQDGWLVVLVDHGFPSVTGFHLPSGVSDPVRSPRPTRGPGHSRMNRWPRLGAWRAPGRNGSTPARSG